MRRLLLLLCLLTGLWGGLALGAQAPPPAPVRWVTDGPGLLSAPARDALDRRLEAYQRATGHQVLLWIGAGTGGAPLEDFAVRAFAAWKVGRGGQDDGLVLFVFPGEHKVRIEVGYGLEGQITDALAARIIQETLLPGLKAGDPDGALTAGMDRILKALGGEAAPGPAHRARAPGWQPGDPISPGAWAVLGILGLGLLALLITHPGLVVWFLVELLVDSIGGGGGSGGSSGGGGFSGGGGSSGGGGASGSW